MKFSIITVVKNELTKIGLTVKSIKNQTFKDYEHIICDGNSTDGTSEYLKKNLDDKTLYFRESDHGIYNAINKSFKKASGQYLIFLHSGDFFYSNHTLDLLSRFIDKNDNYDFYHSNILFYSQRNTKVTRVWKIPVEGNSKLNFLKIAHTTLCIKKKISENIFYDEKFRVSSDIDYLYNLCKNFNGKYFDNFFIFMEDQGLSSSRKYFLIKLKEDIKILYRNFNFSFLFILLYKLCIKVPGFFKKKKLYNENLNIEKNKLFNKKN
tara:strand:+ start:3274 stop:4068 length:795 start_codon:yes stop_codon:yes gene_type:complete